MPGCLEFQGPLNTGGYGQLAIKQNDGSWKMCMAHRLAWAMHNGADPTGMQVMHTCDNRKCVNPDHLRLGTALENNRDMFAKGRGDSWGNKSTGWDLSRREPGGTRVKRGSRKQA